MASKIKKSSSDVSFSLSRWFRRLSTNAPTVTLITILGLSYAIFLFGGGLFTLINHPIPVYIGQGGSPIYFLYPDLSSQFGGDTFVSVSLYVLGFVGMLMIYQSSKSAYKPRQAYMLLIIGVAFLLMSYLLLEGSISFKEHRGA